jgi:hypothetical protein
MWESLDKGVSAYLRPWQLGREARAQLRIRESELLVIAQAERNADEIRSGRKKIVQHGQTIMLLPNSAEVIEGRAEPALNIEGLLTAAGEGKAVNAFREELNIAKTILKAEQVLFNDPSEPPSTTADTDWLYRWRACASQMSSDELQSLFGKVLAEEIKAPGTFALRTLDFLKNLSKEEAAKMQYVCPYITDRSLIPTYGVMSHQQAAHDNPDFRFFLQDLGLISGTGYLGNILRTFVSMSESDFYLVLRINDHAIIARGPDPKAVLQMHGYRATTLGAEAFSLCPMPSSPEYVRAVAQHCKSAGFDVSIASCRPSLEAAGEFELFDETPI